MTSFPEWLVPMAATLTQERFTGPEWLFERKLDGIRMLAFKQGTKVTLSSRNRVPQHYPTVADAIAKLPVKDAILDGDLLEASEHDGERAGVVRPGLDGHGGRGRGAVVVGDEAEPAWIFRAEHDVGTVNIGVAGADRGDSVLEVALEVFGLGAACPEGLHGGGREVGREQGDHGAEP